MLKLFRDYLFHSVTEDGRPWMDHAHIVQCLNRLDAGTMEKVSGEVRDHGQNDESHWGNDIVPGPTHVPG